MAISLDQQMSRAFKAWTKIETSEGLPHYFIITFNDFYLSIHQTDKAKDAWHVECSHMDPTWIGETVKEDMLASDFRMSQLGKVLRQQKDQRMSYADFQAFRDERYKELCPNDPKFMQGSLLE